MHNTEPIPHGTYCAIVCILKSGTTRVVALQIHAGTAWTVLTIAPKISHFDYLALVGTVAKRPYDRAELYLAKRRVSCKENSTTQNRRKCTNSGG